jgi:hypothetical protein
VDWGSKWPREAWTLEEPQWYAEPNYAVVARVAREWVAAKRKKLAAAGGAGAEAGAGEVRACLCLCVCVCVCVRVCASVVG